VSWYVCWSCGLRIGPDDGLEIASRICSLCWLAKHGSPSGSGSTCGKWEDEEGER